MHKKRLIFLTVIVLFMAGCTKLTNDLDSIVQTVFSGKQVAANVASTDYEIYLPAGVKQEFDTEYNQKFKIRDRYVYLYVDTISYYYKNKLNYKHEDDYNYYFKTINYNNKEGYIGINKEKDDLLFVEIVYNYSKIEFYCDIDDLPVVLANSLIIIKNIKYNDSMISVALTDGNSDGRELKYQLDSPKDSESTFSDYLQEYVPEEDHEDIELPDE